MVQRGNGLWLTPAVLSEFAGSPVAAAALGVASWLGAVVARPPELSPAR